MTTDAEPRAVEQEPAAAPDEGGGSDDDARVLPRWALPAGIVAILALVVVVGRAFGVGPAILVLAATALLVVVGFLFRAVQSIAEPHDDENARDVLPPTLAEEQKRAALRALKELEFEKSVGNISPEDYEVIVDRYREEAKRAMRAVDDERKTMRERAEKLAKKALSAEISEVPGVDAKKNPFEKTDREKDAGDSGPKATETDCPKCGVSNDDDARFCKGCGAALGDVA